jgi:hypothetical protein
MAWTPAARQSSIASRRARAGSGHIAGMQNLMQKSGMSAEMQRKLRGPIKTIKKAAKGS